MQVEEALGEGAEVAACRKGGEEGFYFGGGMGLGGGGVLQVQGDSDGRVGGLVIFFLSFREFWRV